MELSKADFKAIGKEDSWKYAISIYNACEALRVYRVIVEEIQNVRNQNFRDLLAGKRERLDFEKNQFPGGNYVLLNGTYIGADYLIGLEIKSFFQQAANCFDYLAQLVNCIFMDNPIDAKKVDFSWLHKNEQKINNDDIRAIVSNVYDSVEYQYITDYSNTTKHNFDMGVAATVEVATMNVSISIPAFKKEVAQDQIHFYEKDESLTKMESIHKYVAKIMTSVLDTTIQAVKEKNTNGRA